MIIRLFFLILFSMHCGACSAEVSNAEVEVSLERAVISFSGSVSSDDVSGFKNIVDSGGVLLIRKFTSGNLGGRGAELNEKFSASVVTSDMAFPIKGQTPFSVKVLFPGLPIKNVKGLSRYTFPVAACDLHFGQWMALLKETIAPLPEAVEGSSIILNAVSGCWIYVEAQVIDDILVGGFAVFKREENEVKLVSIIELL
ncbi:hypothetical protein [Cellvibrio sp. OA-2007]|uniref:hypothetical protein n=1 Tax=Cellvibrio sp. OA-2007 TaxID=529823 RepID=UPI000780474B|nr:hypothetical protein [Cellvibrio sp. OA-2007]